MVRCPGCRLAYLTPRLRPQAAAALYQNATYFAAGALAGYDDYAQQERSLRLTFRAFLGRLKRQGLVGGDLADIGCGPGLLLKEARNMFRIRMGTEMSRDQAACASAFCDGVICGGPEDLVGRGPRFDLVTAVSVLEHVYEPIGFVKTCARLLKNTGWLVIVVPDMGAFWRRLMGRRWPSFKLPEHIAYYDRCSLAVLAEKAGLRLWTTFAYHHAFPMALVLHKLGFRMSEAHAHARMARLPLFLPRVMVAAVFRR